MKYFEIEFDNEPRNQEGWDGDVVGDYSICILGERTKYQGSYRVLQRGYGKDEIQICGQCIGDQSV